jgi:hypothetical protein
LPRDSSDDGRAHAEKVVVEAMSSHHMHDNPHLKLTTKWPERPGDHRRATAIVAALKPALERYRDYHAALQNGYEIFMPQVPQPVYHFTNYLEGFAETFRFQPDQATSLLYRKTSTGYELVGAMYTAPPDASELDLLQSNDRLFACYDLLARGIRARGRLSSDRAERRESRCLEADVRQSFCASGPVFGRTGQGPTNITIV